MKTKAITIKYKPTKWQKIVHADKSRFRVLVAHRRFGKTTLAINELVKAALENPGGRYWYVAPTYRQAKTIALRALKEYLPPEFIERKNENDLTFDLINGSEIALKGAENEDSLRGAGLEGMVLDEFQGFSRETWEAVLEPTLAESDGWALFLGTPKGRNAFFEMFQRGNNPDFKDWSSHRWSIVDTKQLGHTRFPMSKINDKKLSVTENTFREEWMAEFLEGAGTVFRGIKEVTDVPLPPGGVEPMWDCTYQMGVDLARLRDWTVITVVNHRMEVVYWDRFQQIDWETQKYKIMAVSDKYHHCPFFLDATGLGDPILNDLQRMGANVRAYKIASASQKKDLIDNLQIRIEQKQIRIPNEPQIIQELEAFTYKVTAANRTVYQTTKGFHDDCVISLALSVWDINPNLRNGIRQDKLFPLEDDY
jgi:hypothetical protein